MSKIYKKNGIWYFDEYFAFLERKQNKIPFGIKNIVLNPNRYLFNRKETFHDSWFMSMNYSFDINKEVSNCVFYFLSPFHDKIYEFQFCDIQKIKIPNKLICKTDLIIHQFSFCKDFFQYDFLFSNSFVPVAKLQNGERFSIFADHLGTPVMAVDGEGKKVWEAEFDIYGKMRTFAGKDKAFIPFRYQGQYEDEETGLYYNRFRYYSPDSGTYISQDPIGLEGSNPNMYAYVSDSNILVDIFGLSGFYLAIRTPQGVAKGKTISFKEALRIVRQGKDVLVSSRSQAIKLAKKAFKGKPMKHVGHNLPKGLKGLPHIHPKQHINSAHIFYH